MEKEIFDYVAARAQALVESPASKQETAAAAQAWLDATTAAGADDAAIEAATETLLAYLDGRPRTIEALIAFAESPAAAQAFGDERAAQMLEGAKARQATGAKFCGCPSCTAASEILAKFGKVEL